MPELSGGGPLRGVRVLDLSRLLPGPACTWLLAEMGAEVVCVEPKGGTPTRAAPPRVGGEGAYFTALHGGKRSVVVDLRHPEAAALLLALAPHFDALVEGFRPGALEEMGLAPERLHAVAPHLVIARLSGYGQTGPWARRPGHDINYLALSGALAGAPVAARGHALYALQLSDLSGSYAAAMGICAALFEVERARARGEAPEGRALDISLTEAALALSAAPLYGFGNRGEEPRPQGELLNGGVDPYRAYECADGAWVTLGALEPKFFEAARAALGPDPSRWAEAFRAAPAAEWVERLAGACVAPVLSYAEVLSHPQHLARGAVARDAEGRAWARSPLYSGPLRPAPALGEHTREVLTAALGPAEAARLMGVGVAAEAPTLAPSTLFATELPPHEPTPHSSPSSSPRPTS